MRTIFFSFQRTLLNYTQYLACYSFSMRFWNFLLTQIRSHNNNTMSAASSCMSYNGQYNTSTVDIESRPQIKVESHKKNLLNISFHFSIYFGLHSSYFSWL